MAGLKKESLIWLDQLDILRARPHAGRPELQKALNVRNSHITNLVSVKACFEPAAIEKVRQAASPQPTGTSQGASSPSELAHPSHVPRLEASAQGNPPHILADQGPGAVDHR